MTWDLFSAAESARRAEREAAERNAAAARTAPPRAVPPEWSVSKVNAYARELIEGSLPPLWVAGEVTNFTRARSGHCYFSLRDDGAQLRCVMWRDDARRLPTTPAEGMEVRAFGRLTLYEQRGEFQLVVTQLEARGEGLWKLAFDRLRAKLDAEGLTAAALKRPIPRFPACVGLVTSSSGAALRDVITVIRRRAPWTRLVLAPCRVQGEGAALEIARAIRLFARARCADVLIIGRGGGSVEDLWAFNEEVVARAIADSPIPTISAVGHETDVTIADLVADLRAPTPSAAAEAAVPDGATLRRHLDSLARCVREAAERQLYDARKQIDEHGADLRALAAQAITARRERLRTTASHLNALSPLSAMARGFAVPLRAGGSVIRRAAEFTPRERFTLRVVDGSVPCAVEPDHAPDASVDG